MPVDLVSYDLAELTGSSLGGFCLCVHSCLDSLGFSMQTTRSSANADGFVSFFVMCMPFGEFSCRIAAAGTSSPVWSQDSVEADILALFLLLGEHIQSSAVSLPMTWP